MEKWIYRILCILTLLVFVAIFLQEKFRFVDIKELSGAVQQIEKYIYCLTSIENSQKAVLEKLRDGLPEGVNPQVVSPKGMLLIGRSKDFNEQQTRDFEIIKRQYKNIADIMTYDDLLKRINNIVFSLEMKEGS